MQLSLREIYAGGAKILAASRLAPGPHHFASSTRDNRKSFSINGALAMEPQHWC